MPKRKPQLDPALDRTIAAPKIIGGSMRGRKLLYSGDIRTRPMKARVREAIFNLISDEVTGRHAIDLFAGTGALGLEAISRGAARATFVEQHFPTAEQVRQNAQALGVEAQASVQPGNTFIWVKRLTEIGPEPAIVFCSPPFAFYLERWDDMLAMIERLRALLPAESVLIVEADNRFNAALLPDAESWDLREYPPARVALWRKN